MLSSQTFAEQAGCSWRNLSHLGDSRKHRGANAHAPGKHLIPGARWPSFCLRSPAFPIGCIWGATMNQPSCS